jgi:hypothetical protein
LLARTNLLHALDVILRFLAWKALDDAIVLTLLTNCARRSKTLKLDRTNSGLWWTQNDIVADVDYESNMA